MKRAGLFAVLVAAVALATAGIASAIHDVPGPGDDPSFIAGKVSNDCVGGQKLDGVGGDITSGTYPFMFDGFAGSITITVNDTADGKTFDFDTDSDSHVITSIYVKGGPFGSNFYNYADPPNPPADAAHDDGLHSPLNLNSGKWYGLSHICVFTDKK